ncbi:rhodanese-like domain-containing protein [Pontibacillus yanchengensis]|uniref:Rhodanese-like domain-containing protein n=2 Tax=Pontibacillus yanchengensis TaxID=462910 RepID=A0ACC7VEY7_9BACI|nr:rhodanese-like domain-containing protein [Pontibacillus yanchengensis]MYL32191.1 rhodanese-like domain-containing protein [Pontibacillus yanchengensis]MYL52771.1 rhodanese-like domain-containing protein [Pontibacillus yanchengensis]
MCVESIIQYVILIGIIWFVISRFMPVKGIANTTPAEVKNRTKEKNVQFIDVRTPREYKTNHQKPFKNIPLGDIATRSSELDKDKEVIVLCQSGMRSMKAAKALKKQGFKHITNVKGGLGAWV